MKNLIVFSLLILSASAHAANRGLSKRCADSIEAYAFGSTAVEIYSGNVNYYEQLRLQSMQVELEKARANLQVDCNPLTQLEDMGSR